MRGRGRERNRERGKEKKRKRAGSFEGNIYRAAVSKTIMDNSKVRPREGVVKIVASRYFTTAVRSASGREVGTHRRKASAVVVRTERERGKTEGTVRSLREESKRSGGSKRNIRENSYQDFNIVYPEDETRAREGRSAYAYTRTCIHMRHGVYVCARRYEISSYLTIRPHGRACVNVILLMTF